MIPLVQAAQVLSQTIGAPVNACVQFIVNVDGYVMQDDRLLLKNPEEVASSMCLKIREALTSIPKEPNVAAVPNWNGNGDADNVVQMPLAIEPEPAPEEVPAAPKRVKRGGRKAGTPNKPKEPAAAAAAKTTPAATTSATTGGRGKRKPAASVSQ